MYIVGLDLGQAQDYTALAIIEVSDEEQPTLHLRHLQRYPLGTPYPQIVAGVTALMARKEMGDDPQLVVDATGVGAAVVDMLYAAGLYFTPVIITGGDVVHREGSAYRVPKRDLVAAVQTLLQTQRLRFAAGMPLVDTLSRELINFRYKITDAGNDTYGGREGEHDDLVLAVALACWAANIFSRHLVRFV
jgi:hypothetical protein